MRLLSHHSQDWFDKYEFLQYEVCKRLPHTDLHPRHLAARLYHTPAPPPQINRYRIYQICLSAEVDVDMLNAPLPSGLVPSPSIQTLATATADYSPPRKATHVHSSKVVSTTHALTATIYIACDRHILLSLGCLGYPGPPSPTASTNNGYR